MRCAIPIAALAIIACTGETRAQFWGNYGGWHASTAAEGYARGMADLTRSAGMANVMNAQAAVIGQEAVSANLDNQIKATETFFNKRAINRAYQESVRRPPLSSEQLASIARDRAPNPLRTSDYDPVTGAISWPAVLRDDRFGEYRDPLDVLFRDRAAAGGDLTVQQFNQVRDLTGGMLSALKADIRNYSANDYLRARNFITSLAHEAQIN
jgi:hypothetical protein